jgi:hypothetical protein
MLSQPKSAVHQQTAKLFQQQYDKNEQLTIKPPQTRNYRKKYVNGSVNLEGHLKKFKTRRELV